MLERGFLATTSFYATYAHQDRHIEHYLEATQESFDLIANALADGSGIEKLHGSVAHTGFKRLT